MDVADFKVARGHKDFAFPKSSEAELLCIVSPMSPSWEQKLTLRVSRPLAIENRPQPG